MANDERSTEEIETDLSKPSVAERGARALSAGAAAGVQKGAEELAFSTLSGAPMDANALVRVLLSTAFASVTTTIAGLKEAATRETARDLFVNHGPELRRNIEKLSADGIETTPRDLDAVFRALIDAHERAADASMRAAATRAAVNSFDPRLSRLGLGKTVLRIVTELEPDALDLLRSVPAVGGKFMLSHASIEGYYLQRLEKSGLVIIKDWLNVGLARDAWYQRTALGTAVLQHVTSLAEDASMEAVDASIREPPPNPRAETKTGEGV